MFKHEKQLFHPVAVERPNPQYAVLMQEQLGGGNGELKAAMQYMSQSFRIKDPEIKDLFLDIAAEELGHMEMVAAIVHQLTRNLTAEQLVEQGFGPYYIDHTTGIWPQAAGGVPFNACEFQSKGDIITDLHEDMAAEQKARSTYDNILRVVTDYDVCEPIKYLREREIVHYQRFGEAKREDCSKKSTVLKAHKYSTFGKILSIRKTQDVGISRPICC